MDARIQKMIDETKQKFGLAAYTLSSYQLYQHVNFIHETYYTLCMEWLPAQMVEQAEEGINPPGTAVIEINVHTGKYTSAVFVKNKTYAENGVQFAKHDKKSIIAWVEQETGVKFGENFQIFREEDGKILFHKYINNCRVSPNGLIEIHYDDAGRLTYYAVYGHYVQREAVNENIFRVDIGRVEHFAKAQMKLVHFPSKATESLIPIYAIEEIFILNDESSTLPVSLYSYVNSVSGLQKLMTWDTALQSAFNEEPLDVQEEITLEQAFSCEPAIELLPITEEDIRRCEAAVLSFLRQQYAADSGKWLLTILYREKSYINAVLTLKTPNPLLFQRKLQIVINSNTFEAVNYYDNEALVNMFSTYKQPEEVNISKQEAFQLLQEYIELKPYYVYSASQKQYLLCGKLDCDYGVHASTGKIVELNEI